MNTEPKIFAQFLATIAWADEEYSAVEKSTIQSIAENLGMPELPKEVDSYINQFKHFTGTEITSSLSEIVPLIHADDKDELLAACILMMGCDDYLADEELSNYFVIAHMLGKSEDEALCLLSGLTNDDEVVVED